MTPESWQRREDYKKWIKRAKVSVRFRWSHLLMAKKAFYAGFQYGSEYKRKDMNALMSNKRR